MPENKSVITLNDNELATVLAALRLFQYEDERGTVPTPIIDISTDMGELPGMGGDEIDRLCERINTAPDPRVYITLEGGLVQSVLSNIVGLHTAIVVDYDVEGADPSELVLGKAYVRTEEIEDMSGLDPDFKAIIDAYVPIWEVEHHTAAQGWVNTWSDENDQPVTFATCEQAEVELSEFLSERPDEDSSAYRISYRFA